mmetsp:Transcript_28307/g.83130  ORF Transcript_28307/g.83130 Transcript_28307/m.83130 type:complete len:205 (-) Transcript_28307:552-1166(-)
MRRLGLRESRSCLVGIVGLGVPGIEVRARRIVRVCAPHSGMRDVFVRWMGVVHVWVGWPCMPVPAMAVVWPHIHHGGGGMHHVPVAATVAHGLLLVVHWRGNADVRRDGYGGGRRVAYAWPLQLGVLWPHVHRRVRSVARVPVRGGVRLHGVGARAWLRVHVRRIDHWMMCSRWSRRRSRPRSHGMAWSRQSGRGRVMDADAML